MTALAPVLVALVAALSLAEPPLPDRPDHVPGPAPAPAPAQPRPAPVPEAPAAVDPPLGSRAGETPPEEKGTAAFQPRPRRAPRQVTLLGAGALGLGGAAWLVEAGYPSLGFSYLQGLNSADDLGATVRFTWTTTEMLLGVQWRREIESSEGSRLGWRIVGGPWFNFGDGFIYPGNQTNLGLEAAPGIAFTPVVGPGLLTVAGDLALTWAFQRGMGVAAEPVLSVAYEVPVAHDTTVGARPYVGVRWGTGSARIPGLDSRLNGGLTLSVTWRMF